MEQIFVSGTGRCGTTFLMIIFTLLNMDTGFKDSLEENIFNNCNSGLERSHKENFKYLKNPVFLEKIEEIVRECKIKYFIIPFRSLSESAKSREHIEYNTQTIEYEPGNIPGGFVNASNVNDQILNYNEWFMGYLEQMIIHDIPTIFIDFNRMVNDVHYLYLKLTPVFDGKITFTEFSNAYDKASEIQKRKINENKMVVCYPIIEWIRYLYVIKRWFFTQCQLSV